MTHSSCLYIAHRGLSSEAPENTLAAFNLAIKGRFPFFELDVHLSKDGIPVVIHDSSLHRTTGKKGEVSQMTLNELKKLDAGSWFNPLFKKETIPTLDEVLKLPRGETGIMIEIKESQKRNGLLVHAVLDILNKNDSFHSGPLLIGSFSHDILSQLKHLNSPYSLVAVADNINDLLIHFNKGFQKIVIDEKMANAKLIEELQRSNCHIWAYTVDDPVRAETLRTMGINGIISNAPHRIRK